MADTRQLDGQASPPHADPDRRAIDGVNQTQTRPIEAGHDTRKTLDAPAGKEWLLRSLMAFTVMLCVGSVALGVWVIDLRADRATDQQEAAKDISELQGDLGSIRQDLADSQDRLAEAEAATTQVAGSLQDVSADLRTIEDQFPLDLTKLGSVSPDGSFSVTAELADCDGWKDCSRDKWQDKFKVLTVSCVSTCRAEGIDGAPARPLSFDRKQSAWTSSGNLDGVTCGDEPLDGRWTLELRTIALSLDDNTLQAERYEGTLRFIVDAGVSNCDAAEAELTVAGVRR